LKGERVLLRKARDSDIVERQALGRHPEVLRGFGVELTIFEPITPEEAAIWVSKISNHSHAWIIEYENKLIGEIRLDNIDPQDRRASLAVGIYDPNLLGKGLGYESIKLCLQHAFDELGLHRLSARVLASNGRAIHCYEKCGFRQEGREREAAFVGGKWEDDLIMGVLVQEPRTKD
jgi:RimJ/RimL family protein N-acetyltransferase